MRKTVALCLVLGLVAVSMVGGSAFAGARKKDRQRTVDVSYECPCPIRVPNAPIQLVTNLGLALVPTNKSERSVMVAVEDETGLPVFALLAQVDPNCTGTCLGEPIGSVCGASSHPLRLPYPGADLGIQIYQGTCDDPTTPARRTKKRAAVR